MTTADMVMIMLMIIDEEDLLVDKRDLTWTHTVRLSYVSLKKIIIFCLGGGDYYGDTYGAGDSYGYGDDYYGGTYDPVVLECLANDPSGGHDANAWIKTPGKFKNK